MTSSHSQAAAAPSATLGPSSPLHRIFIESLTANEALMQHFTQAGIDLKLLNQSNVEFPKLTHNELTSLFSIGDTERNSQLAKKHIASQKQHYEAQKQPAITAADYAKQAVPEAGEGDEENQQSIAAITATSKIQSPLIPHAKTAHDVPHRQERMINRAEAQRITHALLLHLASQFNQLILQSLKVKKRHKSQKEIDALTAQHLPHVLPGTFSDLTQFLLKHLPCDAQGQIECTQHDFRLAFNTFVLQIFPAQAEIEHPEGSLLCTIL